MVEGVDVLGDGLWIGMDQQLHAADLRHVLAEQVHLLELPARIHVKQGKGGGAG